MTVPFFPVSISDSQGSSSNPALEEYPLPPALTDVTNFVWASLRPPSPDPCEPAGFKWIDGRGFQKEGNPAYCLPNDSIEAERLNKQHYDLKTMIQGNHRAPVHEMLKKGCRVLDAGCGTGIWAIEMAREYPNSSFVGTDLVDMLGSSTESAPSNYEFKVGDTRSLPFDNETFDFVFQRFQTISFRETEWPGVIAELVRVMKPGGWIEFVNAQGFLHSRGPKTESFNSKVEQFFKMREINIDVNHILNKDVNITSLQDVKESSLILPLWGPVELTTQLVSNIVHCCSSLKPQLVLSLGLGHEEYDAMVAESINELSQYETYWTIQFLYGRKPVEQAVIGVEAA